MRARLGIPDRACAPSSESWRPVLGRTRPTHETCLDPPVPPGVSAAQLLEIERVAGQGAGAETALDKAQSKLHDFKRKVSGSGSAEPGLHKWDIDDEDDVQGMVRKGQCDR